MNAGPIIHPPLNRHDAGPIEHFERWTFTKEGTQASIRRVTDRARCRRIAVPVVWLRRSHFPLAYHYASDGEQ